MLSESNGRVYLLIFSLTVQRVLLNWAQDEALFCETILDKKKTDATAFSRMAFCGVPFSTHQQILKWCLHYVENRLKLGR
jgi:hypothetical protein